MTIETVGIDKDGYEIGASHLEETIKEAKANAKYMAGSAQYWDEGAEVVGFHKEVSHVEIRKNGEEHSTYETKF